MPEQLTSHPVETTPPTPDTQIEAQSYGSELSDQGAREQGDYDTAFDEIVAHAEELGLTPEETREALDDYAADQETDESGKTPEVEDTGETGFTLEDVLKDPNVLMEHIDSPEADMFTNLEESVTKLSEDVESLAESLGSLGEVLDTFMEMLRDLIKLLQEIVKMQEERDQLETQEEKDEMTREIQKKIDEFGAKYAG